MTIISNIDPRTVTPQAEIQAWLIANSLSLTATMSGSSDELAILKEFTTSETLTEPQIASFKETFFNKRSQGSMGVDIASGATITLTQGNLFDVTGTTTINYITTTDWKKGSMVCLMFLAGSITLTHNTSSVPANTAATFLSAGINGSFTVGSVLTLIYDGTYWREITRMIV